MPYYTIKENRNSNPFFINVFHQQYINLRKLTTNEKQIQILFTINATKKRKKKKEIQMHLEMPQEN